MKKLFILTFAILFTNNSFVQANHKTFEYHFWGNNFFEVEGSKKYYKFKKNIVVDKDVKKAIDNSNKTGLISYLLFENNTITVDEQNLPTNIKNNNNLLMSNSVGKSLVSYVTGHAICEGYIDSIDVTLNDWPLLNGTLYNGQKLIDILNMSAGDQKIIGEKNFKSDNYIKDGKINVNIMPIGVYLQSDLLQNTKKGKSVYNYNALATNVIMNYVIHKTGDDWEKLLHKVFNEYVKVENNVYFNQTTQRHQKPKTGRYTFFATHYDYLRIAKTMLDDWNNDTCVGKYLKTVYERRINKNEKPPQKNMGIFAYTKSYGGQFHFDVIGIKNRKILGMDGYGGQQVVIDFDKGRIIVVNSVDRHYNWQKLVYKKLK
jgi:hypothetical protein